MTFRPHSKYKTSGSEWLPEIPEHWTLVPLKYVALLKGRLGWQGLRADEYTEDGPFLVTSEHFANDRVDWKRCHHVSLERYELAPEIQLQPHDLLMMKDGAAMGKLAYVHELPGLACLNSHLLLFRPRGDRFMNRFLYYVLGTAVFAAYVAQKKTGTTFFGISQERIGQFPLVLPPLDEQIAIASFLDSETGKIDALVDEQQRLIELLREKRKAVISHAVTKGLNPDTKIKDSGVEWLGEVPEHWEVRSISSLSTKITNGYVGPTRDILVDDGVRYLQSLHIKNNRIIFDVPYYVTKEWSDNHEKSILKKGDVLVVQTGDIGQVAVVPDEFSGCNCHALIIVSPRHDVIYGDWLSWVLNSEYGFHCLLSIQTGALHPHLNCGNVKTLYVPVPPKSEQLELTQWLETILREIDELVTTVETAVSLLQERRAALISAAVTGKIDVRDERELETAVA